ncbi:MAG: molybdopterin-guanine dinucleotide biosynthesis protein B [Gemmatimonadetes bacterium]|nr:molybdopterin-guanine dinucleotide biosynthesis protein B [Gemmatimonadota bacterium]
MAGTRLVSVIGTKNSGKTTLVVALASNFVRRGNVVSTIKHGSHPATLDVEGTDTWRHFNEANVHQTMIESPGQRTLFERVEEESDPVSLVKKYMSGADLVIVEGFKKYPIPKIEIVRKENGQQPIFGSEGTRPEDWIALVTDDLTIEAPIPVIRFDHTSWLMTLSRLAWDNALVIDS